MWWKDHHGALKCTVWCFTTALLSVSVVYLFWGPLVGLGWHLIHDGSIAYRSWRVSVPQWFFVLHRDGEPYIARASIGYGLPHIHSPSAYISLHDLPPDHAFHFERDFVTVSNKLIALEFARGYRFSGSRTITLAGTKAYCLEFSGSQLEFGRVIDCSIDGSTLALAYVGSPEFVEQFYSIVAELSKEPVSAPNTSAVPQNLRS